MSKHNLTYLQLQEGKPNQLNSIRQNNSYINLQFQLNKKELNLCILQKQWISKLSNELKFPLEKIQRMHITNGMYLQKSDFWILEKNQKNFCRNNTSSTHMLNSKSNTVRSQESQNNWLNSQNSSKSSINATLLLYIDIYFLYQLLRVHMDQQILLQARIAYFLGNYSKVLEIWQQNDADDDYFYFLVSRALIASRELKPKTLPLTKKPSQKLLEITDIVSRLMGPLIKQQKSDTTIDEDRKQIEDILKKLKDMIPQQNQKILQIICAYLSVNSCEAQYALNLELPKDAFLQELRFLQLMIYLRGRRLDLAEQTLLELKRIDDEDILSYLGDIYSNIYNGFPDQALKNIQETKDRFGDSAKLMNLMISCLINQNKFDEAFELGQKVKNIIVERDQFSDRQEIETCLSNLIVLSEIQGKNQQRDECLQILEQVNKSCHFLKRYAEKVSKIESLQ